MVGVFELRADISWDNRRVVEQLKKATAMLCQDYLLLGALNRSCEFGSIGFLELLTGLPESVTGDPSLDTL